MVDLHLHSTFSDGSDSPEALVDLAIEAKLTAISLTDHDTTEGTERFLAAASACGISTITGIELSVEGPDGSLHMLGYGIDPADSALQENLKELRNGRHRRNEKILQKLDNLGLSLDYDNVVGLAGNDEVVGRPHIAAAMVAAGYVETRQEAFQKYLIQGAPAYADRLRLGAARAMSLIRSAGGLPVLAHPHLLRLKRKPLQKLVAQLRRNGLAGIEVWHSRHNHNVIAALHGIAHDLGLLVTGGSDYHGQFKGSVRIGVGPGHLRVPDECFAKLMANLS